LLFLHLVEIVGRPIIRLAKDVQNREFDTDGFEEVVPLVTREDKNYNNRQGLLLSMGWLPKKFRSPSCRHRIERVDRQRFVGFVSKLSDLSNKQYFNGNAYQKGRDFYANADIEDMVKSSDLENKAEASVAVIECLTETGVYDERSPSRRGTDAQFTVPYPWPKTEAGALQLDKMPWDYRNEATHYFVGSVLGFLVGASIF
jgi:hypothetical protein